MKSYGIYIPGEPVAKARPRVSRNGHVYTPRKTTDHENKIREEWRNAFGSDKDPCTGQISIYIEFYLKKPARVPKEFPERPQKKPDIDNLVKTVLDALNGIAYEDDKQIVKVNASKYWSDRPRGYTYVEVFEED